MGITCFRVRRVSNEMNAALVLANGTVFWGKGAGALGEAVGEVCFNTSMSGYQEILTDPSYAGQLITFTFPHIGNVGTNPEDIESNKPAARGCVFREDITEPSNWRSAGHLDGWLKDMGVPAITGIDTRSLTRHVRDHGAPSGILIHAKGEKDIAIPSLVEKAKTWPGLKGMDLVKAVTCKKRYYWSEATWKLGRGFGKTPNPRFHVIAVDYGIKRNILRCLSSLGCKITVVPADTTAEEITTLKPDGIFLSNGPGDPAATGTYAVPIIREFVESNIPIFGICLGHQLLAITLGAKTTKLHMGHRGANQPVKNLETNQVEITTQNHGFVVERNSLPSDVIETHRSLFDGSVEGIRVKNKAIFSVQYHPEASPGPHDSHYLFEKFITLMKRASN